jgi:hypothetical protein
LQDADGKSAVDRLFGLKLHTKLKCEETGEEFEVRRGGSSELFTMAAAAASTSANANSWSVSRLEYRLQQ